MTYNVTKGRYVRFDEEVSPFGGGDEGEEEEGAVS